MFHFIHVARNVSFETKKATLILFFIIISISLLSACGKKGGLFLPAPEPMVLVEQPQVATPVESKVETESETGSEFGPESNVEPSDDLEQQKNKPSEQ